MLKRVFDVLFAALGLVLLSPLIVLIALFIASTSKGPIFFRQIRVGLRGEHFTMYKFRTMVERSESPNKICAKNDPRITRIGFILRATKLDEIPQFVNVVKGDMSIIGPRPHVPEIVEHYTEEQRKVLEAKPGIIGPAQIISRNDDDMLPDDISDVQGYYIDHILPYKLKIDLEYVRNIGLRNDVKLLLMGLQEILLGSFKPAALRGKTGWPVLFVVDSILITLSYFIAYCLRFDWSIPSYELTTFLYSVPIVFSLRIVFFYTFRLYHSFFEFISIKDVFQIIKACTLSTISIIITIFFFGLRVHSRSIFIIDWVLILILTVGIRALLRILSERKTLSTYLPRRNILIVGAGNVGEMLTRQVSRNGYEAKIVGFVDDNPAKIGSSIHGIRVYGNRHDIPNLTQVLHVDEILIAINKIEPHEIRSILSYCEKAHVRHHIVPAVKDLVSGKIQLSKIREVSVSDLLGRQPLILDFSAIDNLISGKRILVTGAGGSIGSELCRQIIKYKPGNMILIDRNENYLYELECELNDDNSTIKPLFRVMDIRDARKMERLFAEYRPQIVFHAAAQKHVPLSETNIDEAVSNNVWGTRVVAILSDKFHAERFVMISTDKAVRPTSIMGVTKRVAELHIQVLALRSNTRFTTVRFGNVLNSHGSVVPLFMKQIERGGPITITHPNIERYFMSISEAVQLVIQATTMGEGGEIFILDMGNKIKIIDLAFDLIKQAGLEPYEDIDIKFTGLRKGEKMTEELAGPGEEGLETKHDRIHVLRQKNNIDFEKLDRKIKNLCKCISDASDIVIRNKLKQIVPEFIPYLDSQLVKEQQTFQLANLESGIEDTLTSYL